MGSDVAEDLNPYAQIIIKEASVEASLWKYSMRKAAISN